MFLASERTELEIGIIAVVRDINTVFVWAVDKRKELTFVAILSQPVQT